MQNIKHAGIMGRIGDAYKFKTITDAYRDSVNADKDAAGKVREARSKGGIPEHVNPGFDAENRKRQRDALLKGGLGLVESGVAYGLPIAVGTYLYKKRKTNRNKEVDYTTQKSAGLSMDDILKNTKKKDVGADGVNAVSSSGVMPVIPGGPNKINASSGIVKGVSPIAQPKVKLEKVDGLKAAAVDLPESLHENYLAGATAKLGPNDSVEAIIRRVNQGYLLPSEAGAALEVYEQNRRNKSSSDVFRKALTSSLAQFASTVAGKDSFGMLSPAIGSVVGSGVNAYTDKDNVDSFTEKSIRDIARGASVRGTGKALFKYKLRRSGDDIYDALEIPESVKDTVLSGKRVAPPLSVYDIVSALPPKSQQDIAEIIRSEYDGDMHEALSDAKNTKLQSIITGENLNHSDALKYQIAIMEKEEKLKGETGYNDYSPSKLRFKARYSISPEFEKKLDRLSGISYTSDNMRDTIKSSKSKLKPEIYEGLGQLIGGTAGYGLVAAGGKLLSGNPEIYKNRFMLGAGSAIAGIVGRLVAHKVNENRRIYNDKKTKEVITSEE